MKILQTCVMSSALILVSTTVAAPSTTKLPTKEPMCIVDSNGVEQCIPPKAAAPTLKNVIVHGAPGISNRPSQTERQQNFYKEKALKEPGLSHSLAR